MVNVKKVGDFFSIRELRQKGLQILGLIGLSILAEAQIQVGLAQSPDNLPDDEAAEILQVGIGGTPPFLVESVNGDFQGIVPDIWETIAFVNGWEYELILQTETQAALDAVATGELDLLVGPFSITASV